MTVSILLLGTLCLAQVLSSTRIQDLESEIIFSHALHVGELEFECGTCHTEIESSGSSADRNYPYMDVCGECHDVDDDETCGQCHRDPEEPESIPDVERTVHFSHQNHLGRQVDCARCHENVVASGFAGEEHLPSMVICTGCHDGEEVDNSCDLCHMEPITLTDIHPEGWRHQHGDRAAIEPDWCGSCHNLERSCIACHRGDNLSGQIHELNYQFTHGLDAQSKTSDCSRCHDRESFCNDCHEQGLRMPLNHSTSRWRIDHGSAAKADIEICASCHDSADPTCARAGCHRDSDGLIGTDHPIHPRDLGRFDSEGPWHDDGGYMCFQCHRNTRVAGQGFCGYCHGSEE